MYANSLDPDDAPSNLAYQNQRYFTVSLHLNKITEYLSSLKIEAVNNFDSPQFDWASNGQTSTWAMIECNNSVPFRIYNYMYTE